MSYGFCDNPDEHRREGATDYERRGRGDWDKMHGWDDCDREYQRGFREAQRDEERRQEEQEAENRRAERREQERAEMRRQEELQEYWEDERRRHESECEMSENGEMEQETFP